MNLKQYFLPAYFSLAFFKSRNNQKVKNCREKVYRSTILYMLGSGIFGKPNAQSMFLVRGGQMVWQYSTPLKTTTGVMQEFDEVLIQTNLFKRNSLDINNKRIFQLTAHSQQFS